MPGDSRLAPVRRDFRLLPVGGSIARGLPASLIFIADQQPAEQSAAFQHASKAARVGSDFLPSLETIMPTVDDQLLQRYRRYLNVERKFADSTVRTYLSDVDTFLDWCGETDEMPQAMDRAMFSRYVAYLLTEAPNRRSGSKPQRLERTAAKRKLAGLRCFCDFLVQERWFKATPVPSGRSMPMKTAQSLPSFLTHAKVNRLMEACNPQSHLGVRDRAILELLYASGPHLAELHQLNTADVDLITNSVTILGQRGRERNVPFGEAAWRWLREYLSGARPTLARDDNPALWLNNGGDRLSRKTIGRIVKRYAALAGLGTSGVHPLTLRHSFAAHLLDGGADIRVVQALLGHEDSGSTEVFLPITLEEYRRTYLEHHPMAKATAAGLPTRIKG